MSGHPISVDRLELTDVWEAYRRGAVEIRAHPDATDEQIGRACDAYVKMVIADKASRVPPVPASGGAAGGGRAMTGEEQELLRRIFLSDAVVRASCEKCGRFRKLTLYATALWCGTCISREERRINTREMWGRGRRGY